MTQAFAETAMKTCWILESLVVAVAALWIASAAAQSPAVSPNEEARQTAG
jgi:hypothetical protein